MMWKQFDEGKSVGKPGSENGLIVRDEEHVEGARITLERKCTAAPFSITCGVYGWMFHTRFFGSEAEAEAEFDLMKDSLARILEIIPGKDEPDVDAKCARVSESISEFVERFP